HWELSRENMELYVVPSDMKADLPVELGSSHKDAQQV
ncbi:gntR family transcriptional regulator domain protein, partial [Brucella lupini]